MLSMLSFSYFAFSLFAGVDLSKMDVTSRKPSYHSQRRYP